MTKFESLFGIEPGELRKTCVLAPFISKEGLKDFNIRHFVRGKLYGAGNSRDFTFVHTGLGPALIGDAALYLAESGAKNLILFGSCGLLFRNNGLDIGNLVVPSQSYSLESFSRILTDESIPGQPYYPDEGLLNKFLGFSRDKGIREVSCATIASLKLEGERAEDYSAQGIDVLDMEASAFFAASVHGGSRALAIFYVSDIIRERPFYYKLSFPDRLKLQAGIKKAISILCDFIRENPSA